MKISVYCSDCMVSIPLPAVDAPPGEVACPGGHPPIPFEHRAPVPAGGAPERCSRCGHAAFYRQLDFDQRVGCVILFAGAVIALAVSKAFGGIWFVPVLLVFAAADFVLARRVGTVVICYRCDSEYRDVPDLTRYRPYDAHIAERDAPLKTVRRMNP
ncbi:MAG: hypothetical protein ABIT01_00705 [Thermoanaerobaculia bacterium]